MEPIKIFVGTVQALCPDLSDDDLKAFESGLTVKYFKNVTIVDKIASYDYGKFIHILDAEGNKIELWEPKK